jgi:hypothetical protein
MVNREFYYVFHDDEVRNWKYCPICGNEILEVYPGDYFGYISCMGEHGADETIDFTVTYKDVPE